MLLHLRSSLFVVGYLAATGIYGTLALFLWVVPTRLRHRLIISWTLFVIYWLRVTCGVRYRVIGREHIAAAGRPVVILSKHQSTWETLYLQNLFFPASTILKKELLRLPFFGWGLRALNPIGIDRSNPRDALRQVKLEGVKRLREDYNLLLFPEGTRMKPGERGKYARSGGEIACEADVPVIPVAVNAGRCWPAGTFLKYPGEIKVIIGEPIPSHGRTSRELTQAVESFIEGEMEKLKAAEATTSSATF